MNVRRALLLAAVAVTLTALPSIAEPQAVPLLSFKREYFENSLWTIDRARMTGGQEVQGNIEGLGGSNDALIVYKVDGQFDMFEAVIGYRDSAPDNRSAIFEVWADGQMLDRVGPLLSQEPPETIRVPIKGAQLLQLRIHPQSYDSSHGALWGEPKLWTGIQGKFPGTVLMNVNGRAMQTMPTRPGSGKEEIAVPLPLKPGVQEYRVRMEYDDKTGQLKVKSEPVAPTETPAPTTTP